MRYVTDTCFYRAVASLMLYVDSAGGYSMWHIILGRAVSGIGGAGTLTVASVIITGTTQKDSLRYPETKRLLSRPSPEKRYRSMEVLHQHRNDSRPQSRRTNRWLASRHDRMAMVCLITKYLNLFHGLYMLRSYQDVPHSSHPILSRCTSRRSQASHRDTASR